MKQIHQYTEPHSESGFKSSHTGMYMISISPCVNTNKHNKQRPYIWPATALSKLLWLYMYNNSECH